MARASRTRRTVTVVVVIAVLAAAAAAAYWFWGRRPAAQPAATTQSVAASLTTQQQTVSASGTFVPAQQANLNFAASGTVTSVTAVVGQHVTAGTTLATIDPTALTNAVTQAQAGLESAQAQQNAAQSNTSATQAQLDSAQAAVNAAQAKLQAAQNAVANATLTSPIDGTVAAVTIAPGTTVSAASSTSGQAGGSGGGSGSGGQGAGSGQGGSGQYSGSQGGSGTASGGGSSSSSNAQIVVINTSSWLVQASVTAADLPSIKTGLQAQITPTGTTQKVFGTVSSVGVIGSTSGGTATFPVVIAVTGAPTGIYDGSTGDVAIIVKQYTDILTIPTAAVLTENGQTVVHQTKDGKQVSTPVTVGMIFGNLTEITQGLAEGDEVLVTTSGGRPGRGGSANPSAGGTPRTRGGYGSGGNGSGSNAGGRGTGPGGSGQGGSGSGSGQSDSGNR